MRILIRGMKMPKNCHECPLFESKYNCHGCHAVPKSFYDIDMWEFVSNYRPSWCPLVELPPHSRLGDLDELHKEAVRRSEKTGNDNWYNCMDRVISAFDIENAPTIIPAEESEKCEKVKKR